jgi:hypothetical protein
MKVHQNNSGKKPARLTPEILRALQEAMSDVIKPEYKERRKDDHKKKRRKKNKNHKK